jgi:hypothetical protein
LRKVSSRLRELLEEKLAAATTTIQSSHQNFDTRCLE